MKAINRFGSLAAVLMLALGAIALAAPKVEAASKYLKVTGTVLQIDRKDRTLLVADRASQKLYLIEVPEGARFKITFGRYMRMGDPGLRDVNIRERVEIRCTRTDKEHLSKLDDGRVVIRLTAAG
jgi:hypothetical protein